MRAWVDEIQAWGPKQDITERVKTYSGPVGRPKKKKATAKRAKIARRKNR